MGYTITSQQQKEMHASLDIDENGRVVFIEFVKLAQDMFAFKLDESRLETNLMLALTQKEDLDMPPMPTKVTSSSYNGGEFQFIQYHAMYIQATSYEHLSLKEPFIKPASSQPILVASSNSIHSESELEMMRQKLHDLGRDKEKMVSDAVRHELEEEKRLTARLKV